MLMVRNSTGLRLWLECSIPGGSQTANSGGAKKRCPAIFSAITPVLTQISCPQSWLCGRYSVSALVSSQRKKSVRGAATSAVG
ncbi:hypothetical protein D3C80_2113710 [compost metagenome]